MVAKQDSVENIKRMEVRERTDGYSLKMFYGEGEDERSITVYVGEYAFRALQSGFTLIHQNRGDIK